ncbi:hypothetical protein ACFX2H_012722 [Malus domestica]
MSAGQINVPIVFKGPNGAAAVLVPIILNLMPHAEVLDPVFASQLEKLRLRDKGRMSLLQLFSKMVGYSLQAAEILAKEGISAEHGVGAEICASVIEDSFGYLDAPVKRISRADVPMPYVANLERLAVPQFEDIVRAAKRACYKSSSLAASA